MYTQFFGLKEQPFNLTPDPRFIYFSDSHREALARMTFGVNMKRGFMSITGEVGTGKTTLVYALLSRLDANTQKAFIFHSIMGAKGLFRSICREFGIEMKSDDTKTDMTMRLHNFLIANFRSGNNAVLIIDEAQNLNPLVLEEIRLLSNLETSRTKLLQILLVGQPEFRKILDRPDMRQLKQRIAMKFHLNKLNRKETGEYINYRIQVARHDASGENGSGKKLSREESTTNKSIEDNVSEDVPLYGYLSWEELRIREMGRHQSSHDISPGSDSSRQESLDGKLARNNNSDEIFSPEAIDEIYRCSGGVPRIINILCDKALLMGYTIDTHRISAQIIRRVEFEDLYSEIEPLPKKTHWEIEPGRYPIEDKIPEKKEPVSFNITANSTIQKKSGEDNSRLNRLKKRFPNLFSIAP